MIAHQPTGMETFGPALNATIFQVQSLEMLVEKELRENPLSHDEDEGPLRALERVHSALRDLQVARIKLQSLA